MSPIRELIREIHRRSLWQVLLIYVVGAWIAFEVVQTLTEGLGLPTWFPALAFVLLLVGLPIVIATAFVQEGPPTSIRDDPTLFPGSGPAARSEAAPAQDRADRPSFARWLNWRNAILGGLAAFALWGIVAAAWLLLDLGARGQAASGPGEGTLSTGSAVADESSAPAGEGAAVLSLETDPPEVEVTLVPVRPGPVSDTGAARNLGRTPLSGRRVPVGEYLVRLSMERVNPLEFLVELEPGDSIHLRRSLVSTSPLTEGMVLVSDGPVPAAAGGGAVPRAYLIDRHEVTNAEFLEFVSADGYQDPSFWPETMQVEDRRLPRAEALGHFVDRTGRPGPRYWSGGLYPEGEGEHPVVGVSWYEAQAYARWADKELPGWGQWWRAAFGSEGGVFPWGDEVEALDRRANFSLQGSRPVASYSLGVSPFGVYDMAGNVREWLGEPTPDGRRRLVVGGSWQDPTYMFDPDNAEGFDPGFANEVTGFRCVKPLGRGS